MHKILSSCFQANKFENKMVFKPNMLVKFAQILEADEKAYRKVKLWNILQ